jgi:hypothetical protein
VAASNDNVPLAYLTSAEAASYLRYRNASGIRAAVRRGELVPDGAGPRGTHLFMKQTLDPFVRMRARSLGRLVSRPALGAQDNDTDEVRRDREGRSEHVQHPRAGDVELEQSLVVEKAPRVRLRDFATSWLDGRIAAGKLKPSSAEKVAVVLDLHIATDALADLYVDDIAPDDVERWLAAQRGKKYAPGKGKIDEVGKVLALSRRIRRSGIRPCCSMW